MKTTLRRDAQSEVFTRKDMRNSKLVRCLDDHTPDVLLGWPQTALFEGMITSATQHEPNRSLCNTRARQRSAQTSLQARHISTEVVYTVTLAPFKPASCNLA